MSNETNSQGQILGHNTILDFVCNDGYKKSNDIRKPLQCKAGTLIPVPPKCYEITSENGSAIQNDETLSYAHLTRCILWTIKLSITKWQQAKIYLYLFKIFFVQISMQDVNFNSKYPSLQWFSL